MWKSIIFFWSKFTLKYGIKYPFCLRVPTSLDPITLISDTLGMTNFRLFSEGFSKVGYFLLVYILQTQVEQSKKSFKLGSYSAGGSGVGVFGMVFFLVWDQE